jgi:hypothetical protein
VCGSVAVQVAAEKPVGGIVLDAAPIPKTKNVAEFLKILDTSPAPTTLQARIARRSVNGLSLSQATRETGWRRDFILKQLAEGLQKGFLLRIADALIGVSSFARLKSALTNHTTEFHQKNPLVAGIGKEELRERSQVSEEIFAAALDATHLGVHLIPAERPDLAELFGGETGDDVDKFTECRWEAGPGGEPLLSDCPMRCACRILKRHPFGDHVGFLLEPVATWVADPFEPLDIRDADRIDPGHAP